MSTVGVANIASTCKSSGALRAAYLALLAFEIFGTADYTYPTNYLDRWDTLFVASYWWIWPNLQCDNACMWTKYNVVQNMTFDYVIVGGGVAGSTLAARLSENPAVRVALIEAGGPPNAQSMVPQYFVFMLRGNNTWQYAAEVANTSSNAFTNGCPIMQGKHLGGSSGTNALMHICGQDRDYNKWNASGCTGWDYDSLLPYIKKHQNNTDSSRDPNYHGTTGPVYVTTMNKTYKIYDVLTAGFAELGWQNASDYNAKNYNGYHDVQATIRDGVRCSAYQGYLARTYRNRPNLYFFMNSNVTKILFSGTTAIGVNIKTNNSDCYNIVIKATKEVIVTAGAIGTPKLLQLSGVGQKADLNKFNITQVGGDLPVGENFQDHVYGITWHTANPNASNQTLESLLNDCSNYSPNRTGNFSTTGSLKFGAFIDTLDKKGIYADVQYITYLFPKNQLDFSIVLSNFGYKAPIISKLLDLNAKYELLLIFTILLQPFARGTVKLRSADSNDLPVITSNFLTNDPDVNTVVRGLQNVVALTNTTAFKNISATLVKFDLPDCDPFDYCSDSYWKCYIKTFSASTWHPSGTCKMGAASDPTAVVDPTLKVRGFQNLRVCDAAVFPFIPSGNTQCPCYSVAERAADIIKAAH